MNHTPGPWSLLQSLQTVVVDDGRTVATVNGLIEWEDNAHLMAAAPEMYDALRAIVMGDHLTESEAYQMGSDAIARAEGRS